MLNFYQDGKIRKKDEKPAYFFLSHISDLDFNSKKKTELVQIENYKKIDAFNIKKENINEIDFSEPDVLKINLSNSQVEESKSLNNIQEDESENKINSKCQTNNNTNNNKNIAQQTNKNVLSKPKKGKNIKKNNRGKKNNFIGSNISISNNRSKESQYSSKSGKSTKRTHFLLKTRNSPEKFPEDYLSIDPSSEDEKQIESQKEEEINLNSNSLYYNKIIENGIVMNPEYDPKNEIEEELEGLDLMSIDSKELFRKEDMKKKFFQNIKAEIKIVYFDRNMRPLHAIFVFNEKNSLYLERKLFSGGYNADEFTSFCSEMSKKDIPVKVELLVNFVDMSYEEGLYLDGINKDLYIDIYFLIDIFNEH